MKGSKQGKRFKKVLSLVMSFFLMFGLFQISVRANSNVQDGSIDQLEFERCVDFGNEEEERYLYQFITPSNRKIDTVIEINDNIITCSKYENGVLKGKAILNSETKIIQQISYTTRTDAYQAEQDKIVMGYRYIESNIISQEEVFDSERVFQEYSINVMTKDDIMQSVQMDVQENNLYAYVNESNFLLMGINETQRTDGYEYRRSAGGWEAAPLLQADMFLKENIIDEGYTKYFDFVEDLSLEATEALISFSFPEDLSLVKIIIGILNFAVGEVIAYHQAVELHTYTFDTLYKFEVNGVLILEQSTNITKWELKRENGEVTYETKSFNSGYPGSIDDLFPYCVGTYHNLYHEHSYSNNCDTKCDVCGGGVRTIAHSYSNNCDTTCNVCGTVRTVSGHIYSNDCDTTCNSCGIIRTVAPHVYSNVCDSICNVCGFTRSVAGHSYSNVCDTSCNRCGGIRMVNDHVYSNSCDTDCNNCGFQRRVLGHIFGTDCLSVCSICGASKGLSHSYSNACDTTCNTCGKTRTVSGHKYTNACDTSCNVCGSTRTISHNYSIHTSIGVQGHTSKCSVCGATRSTVGHTFKVTADLGHSGSTHKFARRCTLCNYSGTYSRSCSGSPHVKS